MSFVAMTVTVISVISVIVIPAKAGIHFDLRSEFICAMRHYSQDQDGSQLSLG
jgi:hypothetical protein